MNTEEGTWRRYLDDIVRRKSAAEKQRLYEQVDVTRTTFQRWRGGENTPDASHIFRLLNALPEDEREALRHLMMQDPKVRALLPADHLVRMGKPPDRIPQEVYEDVFRLGRDTPDRFWLLCSTIVFHALSQLEADPTPSGIELMVARLMPPRSDGKIRSLRAYAGRGTFPWRGDFHTKDLFLGAESLAGYAVTKRHGVMVPDRSEQDLPVHWMEGELSCAAYPIIREGAIAGALVVASATTHFFTLERLTLLEKYADLMRLAFYDHEFFSSSMIDLGVFPSWEVQKQSFQSFRQRVNEEYKRAMRDGHPLQELAQSEMRVREHLEEELLYQASISDEPMTVSALPHQPD